MYYGNVGIASGTQNVDRAKLLLDMQKLQDRKQEINNAQTQADSTLNAKYNQMKQAIWDSYGNSPDKQQEYTTMMAELNENFKNQKASLDSTYEKLNAEVNKQAQELECKEAKQRYAKELQDSSPNLFEKNVRKSIFGPAE